MAYRMIKENRIARLMRRVRIEDTSGCWIWLGPRTRKGASGYGASRLNGKTMVSHRVAYELLRGSIPDGYDLDHLCRNRLCCNPDHLEPVTRSVNLRRGFEARGCKNGHPYNEADFSLVHRSNGSLERRCKRCHCERNKRAKGNRSRMREDGAQI